jgi:hypothetical protein
MNHGRVKLKLKKELNFEFNIKPTLDQEVLTIEENIKNSTKNRKNLSVITKGIIIIFLKKRIQVFK